MTFRSVASEPLFSSGFWAGRKPWVFPALLKMSTNYTLVTAAQLAASVASWGLLALVAGRAQRSRSARWVVGLGVLGLSLSPTVSQWDRTLLSESVALSATAVVTAWFIAFVHKPSWIAAGVVTPVLFVWVGTRDTFGQVALAIAILAAAVALRRRSVAWLSLMAVLVAVGLFSTWSALTGHRHEIPLLHAVGDRVMADAEARAFFVERGMPVNETTTALAATWDDGDASPWFTAPETARLRQWLSRHGSKTYVAYLASRPLHSSVEVARNVDVVLGSRELPNSPKPTWYAPGPPHGISRAGGLLYSRSAPVALLVVVLAAFVAALARRRDALLAPMLAVAAGIVAFSLVMAVASWHSDAIEMPRHAVVGAVWLRLAPILLVGVGLHLFAEVNPRCRTLQGRAPAAVLGA